MSGPPLSRLLIVDRRKVQLLLDQRGLHETVGTSLGRRHDLLRVSGAVGCDRANVRHKIGICRHPVAIQVDVAESGACLVELLEGVWEQAIANLADTILASSPLFLTLGELPAALFLVVLFDGHALQRDRPLSLSYE